MSPSDEQSLMGDEALGVESSPAPGVLFDCWDLAGRDVVPDLTATGQPKDVGTNILYGLLQCDGEPWMAPYESLRVAMNVRKKALIPELEEQSDQRLRTWMVNFRNLGLIYDDDHVLRATDAGRGLREVLRSLYQSTDDFARAASVQSRWKVARLIGPVLARYQLRNPATKSNYSPEADIHPLWAIWYAMRELDNKLHWDELDRALTTCLRHADLDDAIEAIRDARTMDGYDPENPAMLDDRLGPRRPVVGGAPDRLEGNQRDRVIIWLQRAAFGDFFLERSNRSDHYRHLNPEFLPLVDELLAERPEYHEVEASTSYFTWLGASLALSSTDAHPAHDRESLLATVVRRCRDHGDRQVIALVGPAGTGKTTLAWDAASALAENDPTRVKKVQFHAAFSYEEFVGGLAPTQGGTGFAPKPGVLIEFNDLASKHPDLTYVLVIDELSRADVANVLGEFLTYVEYRDIEFQVPGLDQTVSLSPNLVVIATLNPADRSVVNMDDALIRRLRQVRVQPSTKALKGILDDAGMTSGLRDAVCAWFDGLPPDAPFGHGLFVGVDSERALYELWHEQLSFYLKRGGITVYPNPAAIEHGYIWRELAPDALRTPESSDDKLTSEEADAGL